ncbi:MAG: PadR family transcriptional regulator, partial [Actinobacteria bacterium]|nr:PadR family transcriptional regulator [Actinomycetota bacterium]
MCPSEIGQRPDGRRWLPGGDDATAWAPQIAPAGRRVRWGRGTGRGPGRGRGGHGRGRRAGRGDVRAAVLALLADEPMHGYQVITELAERTHGGWKPSPGSVYPTLQMLADEG